jgi:hypothetical protein
MKGERDFILFSCHFLQISTEKLDPPAHLAQEPEDQEKPRTKNRTKLEIGGKPQNNGELLLDSL